MRLKLPRPYSLGQIANYSQGILDTEAAGCALQAVLYISTDSRTVERGDLFLALDGTHDSGARHIEEAYRRGAGAVFCCHTVKSDLPLCFIRCYSVTEGLAAWASEHLRTVSPTVIAITGSVGKTTTRHMLSTVLSLSHRVHESPHNYNNLLGTSLTLLTMPSDTDYLVAECGMDGRGQIARLSRMLEPHLGVITNVGVSHLQKLGTRKEICRAKWEIADGMHGGTVFYPGDQPLLSCYAPHTAVPVYVGSGKPCVRYHSAKRGVTYFSYVSRNQTIQNLSLPLMGEHLLRCAALAIAVAERLSVTPKDIRDGLSQYEPVGNRHKLYTFGAHRVIDDSYNASPDSMAGAADTLSLTASDTGATVRLAVLGDMLELGENAPSLHVETGALFARKGATHLICVGDFATEYAKGAASCGMVEEHMRRFETNVCETDVLAEIERICAEPAVVLFKGSNATPISSLASKWIARFKHP